MFENLKPKVTVSTVEQPPINPPEVWPTCASKEELADKTESFIDILLQCLVEDQRYYIPIYDLYSLALNIYSGNELALNGYFGFKNVILKKLRNNEGLRYYISTHYVLGHVKPMICLNSHTVDMAKLNKLVEKIYGKNISNKDAEQKESATSEKKDV